jgi:5-methylcytosine-specific restriction endonuclease McrA
MQMPWEISEAAARKKRKAAHMTDPNQPHQTRVREDTRYPEQHGKGRNSKSRNERRRRQTLFDAQGGLCHWCRQPMQMNPKRRTPTGNLKDNPLYASFEHVIPKGKGGRGLRNNIVLAHASCNHGRHKRRFAHDPIYGNAMEAQ